jgi:hypothetical protein
MTTLRKLKEFIEKLLSDQMQSFQENMNHKAWILHQILVYSFTNKSTDLFADMLIDKATFG